MKFNNMFVVGDRVRVISDCRTYLKVGTVIKTFTNRWNNNNYVSVILDNGVSNNYNELSLEKIGHVELTKENENMSKEVQGNYCVAMVRFVNGTDTTKRYAFALFEP